MVVYLASRDVFLVGNLLIYKNFLVVSRNFHLHLFGHTVFRAQFSNFVNKNCFELMGSISSEKIRVGMNKNRKFGANRVAKVVKVTSESFYSV